MAPKRKRNPLGAASLALPPKPLLSPRVLSHHGTPRRGVSPVVVRAVTPVKAAGGEASTPRVTIGSRVVGCGHPFSVVTTPRGSEGRRTPLPITPHRHHHQRRSSSANSAASSQRQRSCPACEQRRESEGRDEDDLRRPLSKIPYSIRLLSPRSRQGSRSSVSSSCSRREQQHQRTMTPRRSNSTTATAGGGNGCTRSGSTHPSSPSIAATSAVNGGRERTPTAKRKGRTPRVVPAAVASSLPQSASAAPAVPLIPDFPPEDITEHIAAVMRPTTEGEGGVLAAALKLLGAVRLLIATLNASSESPTAEGSTQFRDLHIRQKAAQSHLAAAGAPRVYLEAHGKLLRSLLRVCDARHERYWATFTSESPTHTQHMRELAAITAVDCSFVSQLYQALSQAVLEEWNQTAVASNAWVAVTTLIIEVGPHHFPIANLPSSSGAEEDEKQKVEDDGESGPPTPETPRTPRLLRGCTANNSASSSSSPPFTTIPPPLYSKLHEWCYRRGPMLFEEEEDLPPLLPDGGPSMTPAAQGDSHWASLVEFLHKSVWNPLMEEEADVSVIVSPRGTAAGGGGGVEAVLAASSPLEEHRVRQLRRWASMFLSSLRPLVQECDSEAQMAASTLSRSGQQLQEQVTQWLEGRLTETTCFLWLVLESLTLSLLMRLLAM